MRLLLDESILRAAPAGTTTFSLTRLSLIGAITGTVDLVAALADGTITVEGDPGDLAQFVELLAPVDPDFNIVTP